MLGPGRTLFPYTAARCQQQTPGKGVARISGQHLLAQPLLLPPFAVPQCVGVPDALLALRAWERSGRLPYAPPVNPLDGAPRYGTATWHSPLLWQIGARHVQGRFSEALRLQKRNRPQHAH